MRRFLLFIFFLFVNVSLFADNIEFANNAVKEACVAKWDTDKDGELSYAEAAEVTSLVDKDDANDPFAQLWAWADGSDFSFDEFQYFTGVTSLAGHEFECENLTSIILPNSITSIGRGTFHYCKKLTSIHIPASVTAIYMGSSAPAFNPKYLQTITVDPKNTKYASPEGSNAIIAIFDEKPKTLILGCGNTDFTKIPNTVTTIEQDAFAGVTFANPIVSLPTSVTGIMEYAFMHSNITSINLGELSNLTTIGNEAFSDCKGLTEVTLPASITSMGISVFANCYNIVKVVSNIEEPFNNDNHYYSIYYYIFTIYNDAVLYVPTGKVQAYIDKGWKEIDGEFQSFRVITDGNSTDPVARGGLVYGGSDIWMGGNTQGQRLIYPGAYRDGMMEYSLDGSTYSTSVPLGIDAGEYTVYYRKVGESGVSTLSATIAPKTVSSPTITLSQTSYTYDGTAKEPTVTVKDGETTISPEEYTVGYSNNTNAGTATVTITDKTGGNYAVSGSKTFTINTKTTINNPTITLSQTSYTYDGTAKEPTVTVKDGETTISPEEYTVGYSNNTNVGTATVTITDKEGGNYNVSGSTTFTIVEAGESAKFIYSINPDEITCTITGYTDACTGNVTIPSSIDGHSVTSIGERAFYRCTGLEAITIPNSVTSIGESAFCNCTNLKTVNIPSGVSVISHQAFRGCSSLISIELPDGVSEISDYAFYGCSSLSEFTIPGSLKKMGNNWDNCYTFGDCMSLKKITINKGAKLIGLGAIKNLPIETVIVYNTEPIRVYENFKAIIRDAATLYVPSGCSSAYKEADGWSFFTNVVEMDASVDYSDMGKTFTVDGINYKVSSISPLEVQVGWWRAGAIDKNYEGSLTIPSSVTSPGGKVYSCTSIGYMSFSSRSGLTSITIPNSVTHIDKYAFQSCSGLTTITIPNSVTSIGNSAFYYCTNLTSVTVEVNTPLTITEDVFSNRANATLNVPAGTKTAYQAADYWKEFKEIVEIEQDVSDMLIFSINSDGNTCSVTGHTYACTGDVTIPSSVDGRSVTAIGSKAFKGWSLLTSITIPNSVTSIGDEAFNNCTRLTSIKIPSSVTSIGRKAFWIGLTSINVESSNTKYDSRDNCNAIIITETNELIFGTKNTIIPNSVTSIGAEAFEDCYRTSITIPNSVTSIGAYAFRNCPLTSIIIPNSVTYISDEAFFYCNSLTSINVESGNTKYDSRDNCNAIIFTESNALIRGTKNTIIPNSVTFIGNGAFSGCEDMTSITIPNNVTYIGGNAFYNCSSLTSLKIPNSVSYIGAGAFSCCTGLTSVIVERIQPLTIHSLDFPTRANATLYVPEGSQAAYAAANYWKEFKKIVGVAVPIGKSGLVYTGSSQDLLIAGTSPSAPYLYSSDGTYFSSAIPQGKEAREYTVYYKEEGSTTSNSIKVTIAKAPLTITANSYVRKEREANPGFGVTYEGFKNNETNTVLLTQPMTSCSATQSSSPGIYSITVYGALATNYQIYYATGTLTIEAAPTPHSEPQVFTFDEDVDNSSSKEVKVTFVVNESSGSTTPTVAISDDKDVSGSVAIPETVTHNGVEYKVTEISEGAFQNNTGLTEVSIPASITSIGANAFAGCTNLKSITVNIIVPINLAVIGARGFTRATGDNVFEGVDKNTCILYVPEISVEVYKAAPVWKEFKHILPIKTSTRIYGIESDGEPFDVYNFSGQKVKSKVTSLDGLPRGIYIINGKKVMK